MLRFRPADEESYGVRHAKMILRALGVECTVVEDITWENEQTEDTRRSIRAHRRGIHGLSNARVEAANTKLRLLTRLAYGLHSHPPLIALAMLKLGGLCPPLPRLQ